MTGAPASLRAMWDFDAIGTHWQIETPEPLPTVARERVTAIVEDFDQAWSRFRDDSAVAELAAGAESVPAPLDAADMLAVYAELSDATDGAVNPLVGAALARRGYDAAYSLADSGPQPAPEDWRGRLRIADGRLALDPPAVIDVGALGKGRLVDLVFADLRSLTGDDVLVDASGDLAVVGRPVRVGLEHPFDPARAIGVIEIADHALCASATNRRAWGEGLHHVLDARTGAPVRTIAATWAVAPTAMVADAAATALFFDGGPELAHRWGVQWVRMFTDGRVEWSPDAAAELYL